MSTFVLFSVLRATPADMQAWQVKRETQRSNVDFDGILWPSGAASDASSAISVFTKEVGIIGHRRPSVVQGGQNLPSSAISSGCAIANAVDAGLTDHSNIVLVALDGFVPNRKQLAAKHASLGSQDSRCSS